MLFASNGAYRLSDQSALMLCCMSKQPLVSPLAVVLAFSAVLEGYSLLVATRYVLAGAAAQRMSFVQVNMFVFFEAKLYFSHTCKRMQG